MQKAIIIHTFGNFKSNAYQFQFFSYIFLPILSSLCLHGVFLPTKQKKKGMQ